MTETEALGRGNRRPAAVECQVAPVGGECRTAADARRRGQHHVGAHLLHRERAHRLRACQPAGVAEAGVADRVAFAGDVAVAGGPVGERVHRVRGKVVAVQVAVAAGDRAQVQVGDRVEVIDAVAEGKRLGRQAGVVAARHEFAEERLPREAGGLVGGDLRSHARRVDPLDEERIGHFLCHGGCQRVDARLAPGGLLLRRRLRPARLRAHEECGGNDHQEHQDGGDQDKRVATGMCAGGGSGVARGVDHGVPSLERCTVSPCDAWARRARTGSRDRGRGPGAGRGRCR